MEEKFQQLWNFFRQQHTGGQGHGNKKMQSASHATT